MQKVKQAKKEAQKTSNYNNMGIIAIAVFAFFLFLKLRACDFLVGWDDDTYVVNNPAIQQINWENLKKIFSSFYLGNYQPLSVLSYAIDFSIFKLKPSAYHIINLLFHIANIFLVFKLFKKMQMSNVVCYTVAILFAIHPTRVESIAWIAERKDVMYAMFYLLSIIYYLKFREEKNVKIYLASLGLFLCSALSKSMAITLPVVLILIDIFLDRKFDFKKTFNKIPFFVLSIVFGLLALYSQGHESNAYKIAKDFSVFERVTLVFVAIGKYLVLIVAPFNLSAIQYYPIEPGEAMPIWAYLSMAGVIGLLFLGFKNKKYRFEIGFGLMFFFVSIGMVLQFVPFGHAIIAERYTYLPYLGLFFILGVFIDQLLKNKNKATIVYFISTAFVLYLAAITYQRIAVWQNSITLFSDVVEKFPNTANAYWYRGNAYRDYKALDKAIKDYTKAIELSPTYDAAYFNRAYSLAAQEKHESALPDYDKSIELNPNYAPAYLNKANSLYVLKRYDEAIQFYQKTISVDTSYQAAYLGLADIFVVKNEPTKAKPIYEQYLIKNPSDARAFNSLGIAQYNSNEQAQACESWEKAASLGNVPAREFINKYCR
ncbi:MAG: tetratricopeptide repeat protein [Phycisphaerae bacterium]|nr:tetratricopeptide repeat protein [Saprospiraceae bacterium]